MAKLGAAVTPSLRTVQRIVRDLSLLEEADKPWTLAESSDEEARVALEYLVWLGPYSTEMHGRMGRERGKSAALVSQREVAWIVKIKAAAPDIPFEVARIYAIDYLWREQKGEDAEDLDFGLAYAPTGPETTDEFLWRLISHAKVHWSVWPERTFYATAYEPVTAEVAAQLHIASTVLLPEDAPAAGVVWVPEFDRSPRAEWPPRSPLKDALERGRKELTEIKARWDEHLAAMKPQIIGPENKWGALDEYIQGFVEREKEEAR